MISYFDACVFQEYDKSGNYFPKHFAGNPEKWRSFGMNACVQTFVACVHTKIYKRNIFCDAVFIFRDAVFIFLIGGHKIMHACAKKYETLLLLPSEILRNSFIFVK